MLPAGMRVVGKCLLCGAFLTVLAGAKPVPKQRISFRTVKPIAGHFDSQKEASDTAKTLKQLGCATKTSAHQGHVDVTYECPSWRSLTLRDVEEVARWKQWLLAKGFAVVLNTPRQDDPEVVQYKTPEWRTLHFDKPRDAAAHTDLFRMLGCEVSTSAHDGHQDVKFRCVSWNSIGVSSHQEAHAWMQLLKKYGFATLHEH